MYPSFVPVGAINALGVTGWESTRGHKLPYRADNWNLGNFEGFDHYGTAFEPKQYLYQIVGMGLQNLKM